MPPADDAALTTPAGDRIQYGALPYRRQGEIEILLVTSRETRRWVIPKGWPMKRRTPQGAAAREALEEAGVKGEISKKSIGVYHYMKRLPGGTAVPCEVQVFPLKVKREDPAWRESGQRIRRWFTLAEAVDAVEEPELKALMEAFSSRVVAKVEARQAKRAALQSSTTSSDS
jgi:8-oxo-dGTP pyrophosphatase MutT (NUDIX family)